MKNIFWEDLDNNLLVSRQSTLNNMQKEMTLNQIP